MLDLYDKIQDACHFIRKQFPTVPRAGIILGTGLGGLVGDIEIQSSIEYGDIPHFPKSTATSHRGRLVCGTLSGVPVIAMEGRFHMYEGYPLKQITLPVRVFKELGAELLVVSNACGGLNPYFRSGDIMVIEDQINLLGDTRSLGSTTTASVHVFPTCANHTTSNSLNELSPSPVEKASLRTKVCSSLWQARTWKLELNIVSCAPSAQMSLE